MGNNEDYDIDNDDIDYDNNYGNDEDNRNECWEIEPDYESLQKVLDSSTVN